MDRFTPTLRIALTLGLLLAASLLVVGCSDDNTAPVETAASDDYASLDFGDPYGGLTATDEEEAFGDAALQLELLAEDAEAVDDPVAADAEVLAMEADGQEPGTDPARRPIFTYVVLKWGMIHGPDDSLGAVDSGCDLTDWTGSLRVDRGAVVVRRLLAFERPSDHVIFPRLDRRSVGLVSHTGCHFDGLVLQILERPSDPEAGDYEPNRLHIDLGAFQVEIPVADLAEMDRVSEVDGLGNFFQITGFAMLDIVECAKGFVSGAYRPLPVAVDTTATDEVRGQHLGQFAGRWMDPTGRIRGFLRGGYGLDPEGNRVFVGKYIDRRGTFRGFLRGTWEPGETDADLASFSGAWYDAAGTMEGRVGGEAHPIPDVPGGYFSGRWARFCDEDAVAKVN